eukprot:scaffold4886_cov123-Isochrysis_galbana.AAC.21
MSGCLCLCHALGCALGHRAFVAGEVVFDPRLGQLPPLALLALDQLHLVRLLLLRAPLLRSGGWRSGGGGTKGSSALKRRRCKPELGSGVGGARARATASASAG